MIKLFRKVLSCLVFLVIVIAIFAVVIAMQSYRFWLQSPEGDAEQLVFVVEDGDSFSAVADTLKNRELINSKFWFSVYAKYDGSARKIQAGEFELMRGMNYASIIDELIDADAEEVSITIPEGYTIEQIGEVVMANFYVTPADWGILTGMESPFEDHPFIVSAQKPEDVDLEGYLFPDTYRFFVNAGGKDIVKKMIDTAEERVSSINKTSKDYTLHEVLTLASIVEREVMSEDDKALVADLFLRRLSIGMALQADSTVNYVTGKKTPGISLADRDIESPYNTYQNAGLPPGPISNPGLESIKAVFSPSPNSYLFFLTTPEGEVIYALSHDDHVQNKAKYLR